VATATRRLKHWGWGYEDQQPPRDQVEGIARAVTDRLGFEVDEIEEPVPLEAVELPESRLKPPKELAAMFSAERYDRIAHSLGKAYRDVVRGFRGEYTSPPDLVAYPESAEDVDAILNFCDDEKAAAIPYGGGTSVVGGVEPRMREEYPAVVTIDLHRGHLDPEVATLPLPAENAAIKSGKHPSVSTRENIEAARRFIASQRGSGSTELLAALRVALALPSEADRARSFVVITDGYVSIEKEAMDLVRAHLGDANVFAFGIGSSVNRFLIEGLARAGRGEPFIVLNPLQAAVEADRFCTYIEAPLLTKIRVDFRGFDAYDVDPPQLPDLFALRPLVLSGKFRGAPRGSIEISGVTATGAYHRTIDVSAADGSEQPALATLWARSRIATLGDYEKLVNDSSAAKEITALGLRYSLLTDYTSFIAVDRVVRNTSGEQRTVDQPLPLPAGVTELAVGEVPSTPEPEFASMALAAGALLWWARRRRKERHGAH